MRTISGILQADLVDQISAGGPREHLLQLPWLGTPTELPPMLQTHGLPTRKQESKPAVTISLAIPAI